jgi:hypothetical protein
MLVMTAYFGGRTFEKIMERKDQAKVVEEAAKNGGK